MATRKSTTKPLVLAAALALPITLGGCGIIQQVAAAKAKERMEVERADCRARFPQSHTQVADCMTAAENQTIRQFASNGDLLTLLQAKRKILAVKQDQGQITRDEAQLEWAQFFSAVNSEDLRRTNASRAVAAEEDIGWAIRQGQNRTVNTSCNASGSSVNCTSH